jgi:hypothetical protein
MNSENQTRLLETLESIARSLEIMLDRLDGIEDRIRDLVEALPDEEDAPD